MLQKKSNATDTPPQATLAHNHSTLPPPLAHPFVKITGGREGNLNRTLTLCCLLLVVACLHCCLLSPSLGRLSVHQNSVLHLHPPVPIQTKLATNTNHEYQSRIPITNTNHEYQSRIPITNTNLEYQSKSLETYPLFPLIYHGTYVRIYLLLIPCFPVSLRPYFFLHLSPIYAQTPDCPTTLHFSEPPHVRGWIVDAG